MKKTIRNIVLAVLVLGLAFSITGNWFLLSDNRHLNKKIDTLEKELGKYDEDYKMYYDLYDNCEFNLNETMKTLEEQTKELQSLKKN
jgi:hypothetical protein